MRRAAPSHDTLRCATPLPHHHPHPPHARACHHLRDRVLTPPAPVAYNRSCVCPRGYAERCQELSASMQRQKTASSPSLRSPLFVLFIPPSVSDSLRHFLLRPLPSLTMCTLTIAIHERGPLRVAQRVFAHRAQTHTRRVFAAQLCKHLRTHTNVNPRRPVDFTDLRHKPSLHAMHIGKHFKLLEEVAKNS